MQLDDSEWRLVLDDPATNYQHNDHVMAVTGDVDDPDAQIPVLHLDLEHIETGMRMRLTVRLTPMVVPFLRREFLAMEEVLRQRGAVT